MIKKVGEFVKISITNFYQAPEYAVKHANRHYHIQAEANTLAFKETNILPLNPKESYKVSVLSSLSKIVELLSRQEITFRGTKSKLESKEMNISTGHELFNVDEWRFSNFGAIYLFRLDSGDLEVRDNVKQEPAKPRYYSSDGRHWQQKIMDRLTYYELDPQIRQGQGFDGAASMWGRIKRVRAEITKVQPKAIYTHCYAHSVNLVIGNAVEMGWIHKFYGEVNKIKEYFGTPKRGTLLLETFGCPRGTKVPSTVCDTRWNYADVTSAAFGSYSYLVDGLEALGSNGNFDLDSRNGANALREMML
ncbi:hypothetical protein RvY_06694 [Ramazzottius varieornatus]|uniref:DUF4371 domain-containing protein n=1 Tax=Ramazzottius varieornatus TaxID=947166 RepID=A0A1D1UZG4_RAMVA|nr:hypothetical protein RvY_06694 [Ramazzottius varieornatus]